MSSIPAISPSIPIVHSVQPAHSVADVGAQADQKAVNIVVNQTTNAFLSGGNAFLASEVNISDVPDNSNITVNQVTNLYQASGAAAAYGSPDVKQALDAFVLELEAELLGLDPSVLGQTAAQGQPKQPQKPVDILT